MYGGVGSGVLIFLMNFVLVKVENVMLVGEMDLYNVYGKCFWEDEDGWFRFIVCF